MTSSYGSFKSFDTILTHREWARVYKRKESLVTVLFYMACLFENLFTQTPTRNILKYDNMKMLRCHKVPWFPKFACKLLGPWPTKFSSISSCIINASLRNLIMCSHFNTAYGDRVNQAIEHDLMKSFDNLIKAILRVTLHVEFQQVNSL